MLHLYKDAPLSTLLLAATATTAEFTVVDGGMYGIAVVGLADGASVSIQARLGAAWKTVDSVTKTDLLADGAAYSGISPARLAVGVWRVEVAAAGPVVYIGAAGGG